MCTTINSLLNMWNWCSPNIATIISRIYLNHTFIFLTVICIELQWKFGNCDFIFSGCDTKLQYCRNLELVFNRSYFQKNNLRNCFCGWKYRNFFHIWHAWYIILTLNFCVRCSLEEEIIFKGNSTMNRQCGPLTQTTTPTKSTKIFDANSTSPSSDGNKNFQRLIRFV